MVKILPLISFQDIGKILMSFSFYDKSRFEENFGADQLCRTVVNRVFKCTYYNNARASLQEKAKWEAMMPVEEMTMEEALASGFGNPVGSHQ